MSSTCPSYIPRVDDKMQKLARILQLISRCDPSDSRWNGSDQDAAYARRETLIFEAVAQSRALGMAAGIRVDPKHPDWPIMFIELPTGQVSWHMQEHITQWDGHSTDQKYQRIHSFIRLVRSCRRRKSR